MGPVSVSSARSYVLIPRTCAIRDSGESGEPIRRSLHKAPGPLIHKIRELTRVQALMERTRLFTEIPYQTLLVVVERGCPRLRRNEGESRLSNSLRYKFWFDDPESDQGDQKIDDQGRCEDGPRPSALFGVPGREHCKHRVCWKDVMRQLCLNQCEHEEDD